MPRAGASLRPSLASPPWCTQARGVGSTDVLRGPGWAVAGPRPQGPFLPAPAQIHEERKCHRPLAVAREESPQKARGKGPRGASVPGFLRWPRSPTAAVRDWPSLGPCGQPAPGPRPQSPRGELRSPAARDRQPPAPGSSAVPFGPGAEPPEAGLQERGKAWEPHSQREHRASFFLRKPESCLRTQEPPGVCSLACVRESAGRSAWAGRLRSLLPLAPPRLPPAPLPPSPLPARPPLASPWLGGRREHSLHPVQRDTQGLERACLGQGESHKNDTSQTRSPTPLGAGSLH